MSAPFRQLIPAALLLVPACSAARAQVLDIPS